MKVGIIGVGMVGSAVKHGFEKLGHDVRIHDVKLNTKIEDVLDTELCFISVPTPQGEDGHCDISIVESVVDELVEHEYKGIYVIKSTIKPGTMEYLNEKYGDGWWNRSAFVPEFLRERCSISDFMENHDVCVIGTDSP